MQTGGPIEGDFRGTVRGLQSVWADRPRGEFDWERGEFAGSNRIKHMTTAMAHLRFDGSGRDAERYIEFSKNRRGMVGEKIYFDLHRGECVDYSFENIS